MGNRRSGSGPSLPNIGISSCYYAELQPSAGNASVAFSPIPCRWPEPSIISSPPTRHRSTEGRKEVERLHIHSVRTYELAKLHVEPDTVCLINSSLRSQESRFKKQESKNQRTQEPRSSARGFGGRKGGIRQAASGCYIRKKARDVDAVAVHASLVLL